MFEQTFKNIDDILHKDAGCGSELDYVEQTSWVLFLKYLQLVMFLHLLWPNQHLYLNNKYHLQYLQYMFLLLPSEAP